MKTIGILEAGRTPDELITQHGSYADMLQRLVDSTDSHPIFHYQTFCVMQDVFPETANMCDGWILTGSQHGVYENLPWMLRLQALIREIHQAQIPMIGVCFGHQIIAQALGGKVEKASNGWGVGLHHYQFQEATFPPVQAGKTLILNAMHQDQVIEKPAMAQVLASSDFCPNAALLYGKHILTVQGHPEFTPEFEAALIRLRKGSVIPDDLADQTLKQLENATPPHNSQVAQWMRQLLGG